MEFSFRINVDDTNPHGFCGKLYLFEISLSHCYRFWVYGIELSKWWSYPKFWNTKLWLDFYYGDQHILTNNSKSKRIELKNYHDGAFDD